MPRCKGRLIAALLLAIMAILLITSVRQQSQTFDESTHLFAGFEYWKHGDFGRNPEHSPFVKLLAYLPLLRMGLHEPPTIAGPPGWEAMAAALRLARANHPDYQTYLIYQIEQQQGRP